MSVLEVFLQLGTVFLRAFLAFGLENVRERQQLRGWANDYLRRVRKDLQESKSEASVEGLDRVIAAYELFVTKESIDNYVPSEAEWNSLMWSRIYQYYTH